MARTHTRAARPTADDEATERTDSNGAPTERGPTRSVRLSRGVYAVALLAAVAVVALSPTVPRAALVEAGTYLAPLALFLGLLSTSGTLADGR